MKRKFITKNGISFESNYENDIAPVLVGQHTDDKPLDLEDGKLRSKILDAGWLGSDLVNDAKNARNFITFKVEMLTLQQFAFLKNSILK